MNRKFHILIFMVLLLPSLAAAATLEGSIYNSYLELESDVIVEVNTKPLQKYLSKDGTYSFELSPGDYILTARNSEYIVQEKVEIDSSEGKFVFDIFLLPSFADEDELWQETEDPLGIDPGEEKNSLSYIIAGLIILFALYRIVKARKKFGSLRKFRKKMKEESKKTLEQHKEELAQGPGYVENALEIIKKHDGRISQKELRKEMLYLSEAKVSLIVTELEHKGKVEKIKKGRGNVIILKR